MASCRLPFFCEPNQHHSATLQACCNQIFAVINKSSPDSVSIRLRETGLLHSNFSRRRPRPLCANRVRPEFLARKKMPRDCANPPSKNEAFTSPPPSTNRLVTFSAPSFFNSQRQINLRFEICDLRFLLARPAHLLFSKAATRFFGAFLETTIVVKAANSSLTIFAFSGVRASESKTIRRSWLLL